MKHSTTKRTPRQPVLILSHADGHLEIFAEKHVDIHISRVPVATSREAERQAEEVAEMLLPRLFRNLYRADRLRKSGSTRPLLPSELAKAMRAKKDIAILNRLKDKNKKRPITSLQKTSGGRKW